MPFAAMWMDLEIVILSEVRQRQISNDIDYMWNLKNEANGYQKGKRGYIRILELKYAHHYAWNR